MKNLPLENRQVVVGDLQDDARHRRCIFIGERQVVPASVFLLIIEQLVANSRKPAVPVIAAGLVLSLHSVVMPIVVVRIDQSAWAVPFEIAERSTDLRTLVNSGAVKRDKTRS